MTILVLIRPTCIPQLVLKLFSRRIKCPLTLKQFEVYGRFLEIFSADNFSDDKLKIIRRPEEEERKREEDGEG